MFCFVVSLYFLSLSPPILHTHTHTQTLYRYVHRHAALNVKNGLHNGLRVHVICGQLHWDPATHVYREPSSLIEIERAEACEGGEYVPGTLC